MKKRFLAAALVSAMTLSLMAGCGSSQEETSGAASPEMVSEQEQVTEDSAAVTEAGESAEVTEAAETAEVTAGELEGVTVRIGAMSGCTAMGLVKLMDAAEKGQTNGSYDFAELGTEASAFVAPLTKGELDMAAVPANLASVIYNNTDGAVEVLAVNTLGVLYLLEKGESLNGFSDLAGKTVYMTGQGAVPEYTVRYLLLQNGIDPDTDLTLQFCADTTEALSYLSSSEEAIAILPQPFVTAACAQVEGLRVVCDLNDEWAAVNEDCQITTGVLVVRREFAEAYPNTIACFLQEYEASMNYITEDPEGAAELVEKYGIVAKAAVAQKAMPNCHLQFMTGEEMKTAVSGFLSVLYEMNPASVGGALPGDDFYY